MGKAGINCIFFVAILGITFACSQPQYPNFFIQRFSFTVS